MSYEGKQVTRRAFTIIEVMVCLSILAIVLAITVIPAIRWMNAAAEVPKPTTETKLNIGIGLTSKIIVLPTGERVLLITGISQGLATCCLLPPLAPPKVEAEKQP